jgi:hypothetical protein
VLASADALKSTGLAALGFEYVNLDAGWLTSERNTTTSKLVPVASKWPNGIKHLSDAIHRKGLKFGVYTDISSHSCGWGPGSYDHYTVDAKTFADDWQIDYLKVDYCGAWNGTGGKPLADSCAAGALGAGGDLHKANTTITNATAWCQASPLCGGFTTEGNICGIDGSNIRTNSTSAAGGQVRQIWFKDATSRSNGNSAWSMWQKPGAGRVDYAPKPQYAAWKALGDALNKTGRPIYYSICPHTLGSSRGTASNYTGTLIYAPPTAWTAEQRHGLARCAFSDRILRSRMPLDPTPVRLKRTCV